MPIGAAIGASGVLGAGATIYGANKAASTQQAAAQAATQAQLQMFNTGAAGVTPYAQGGITSYNMLNNNVLPAAMQALGIGPNGLTPGAAQQWLQSTPGYQFTLGQGQKATTNALSVMGLGTSGALGKGLADYTEGLASTTYNSQFGNLLGLAGQTQGAAGIGAGAASSLLGGGIQTGGLIGGNIIGAGNAGAAATMAGANAIGGIGSNALNSYLQYSLLSKLGVMGNTNATAPPPAATVNNAFPVPDSSTMLGPIQGYGNLWPQQ